MVDLGEVVVDVACARDLLLCSVLFPTKKECVSGRILRITDASENVEIFRRPSSSIFVYIQSPIAGVKVCIAFFALDVSLPGFG